MIEITEKLKALRAEVARAAQAANRTPDCVTIVAVSKGHPVQVVSAALAAGLREFGENYLQEALPKMASAGDGPCWHFIGALQANKTRQVAEHFQWVQTVTSLHLAQRLSRQRPHYAGDLQVCIQVRPIAGLAEGPGRRGVSAEELTALACVG